MALFRPQADGTFVVGIEPAVRAWIVEMAEALEETIGTDNPDIRRLFPTAYPHDPERDAGYQIFARGEQIERKHTAIETMRATVDSETFTPEELLAWMGIVNDLRLVLGTRLDVSEDDRKIKRKDPNAEAHMLYRQLGLILEYMVDALSYTLESLANLLSALVDGQQSAVVNLFDDEPMILAQRGGRIVGTDAVKAWVRDSASWLTSFNASIDTTTTVSTETSVVHDAVIWLTVDGQKLDVPCVVVGDRPSPDHGFTAIRIYHSTWQYPDTVHNGVFADSPDVVNVPDIVSDFLRLLQSAKDSANDSANDSADFDELRALFVDGATIRPCSGARFAEIASQASSEFFRQLLGQDEQTKVKLVGVTDDGVTAAFEFQAHGEGLPSSGVGIIERASNGKIHSVRISGDGGSARPGHESH